MTALSKKQRQILEEAHLAERSKRQADRIKTVLLIDKGYSHKEVAQILLLDDSTTRRYEQEYQEGGLDELLDDKFTGGSGKLTKDQENKLSSHLEYTTYSSAKEISEFIKAKFSVTYTPQGLVPLLHRLGFSYKKTKQVPGKADPEKQKVFLKIYHRLRKKVNNANIFLYFLDGSHPQHNSMPAYGWIKKGQEKELKSNTGRQRVNLNGALNIEDHTVVVRDEDTINANSVIRLFEKLEAKHPEADKIYCIADNARYYRARIVQDYIKHSKIELVFLPPYAPNLNLIERLWKFFHKKVMYNQYHSSYEEFREAISIFFDDTNKGRYAPELATLLAENFQIVGRQVSQS
jgi:transposase